jgi:hypothetical protein
MKKSPANRPVKSYLHFLLGLGILFIFNACKKEVYPQEPADTDISRLSALFAERGYNSSLTQAFGDTMSIIWTPAWDQAVRETPNDSTVSIRVELFPQLKNIKTGAMVPDANFLGFAKYIQVEITKTTTFYLAQYATNSAVTKVDLHTFTGLLLLKNLENGKSYVYKYQNGQRI